MILSSFDWDNLHYDYFETKSFKSDIGGWDELQGLGIQNKSKSSGLGIDIEDALPDLPKDSIYIGSGEQAIGRVIKPKHKRRNYTSAVNGLSGLSVLGSDSSLEIIDELVEDLENNSDKNLTKTINSESDKKEIIESSSNVEYSALKAGHVPLSTFIIPFFTGVTLGYYSGTRVKDSGVDYFKIFVGLLGATAVGIKLGKDHSLFASRRKEIKNDKD